MSWCHRVWYRNRSHDLPPQFIFFSGGQHNLFTCRTLNCYFSLQFLTADKLYFCWTINNWLIFYFDKFPPVVVDVTVLLLLLLLQLNSWSDPAVRCLQQAGLQSAGERPHLTGPADSGAQVQVLQLTRTWRGSENNNRTQHWGQQ